MEPVMLEMVRGDTAEFQVFFNDNLGNPINDPTAEYRMTAKVQESDADVAAIFSVTALQYLPGIAIIVVPPASTSGLNSLVHSLVYDIEVTETGGRVTTIQFGRLLVLPDVSQTSP